MDQSELPNLNDQLSNNIILNQEPKKKQKVNCGDKHKEFVTHFWKEIKLKLDVSHVQTFIFRSNH